MQNFFGSLRFERKRRYKYKLLPIKPQSGLSFFKIVTRRSLETQKCKFFKIFRSFWIIVKMFWEIRKIPEMTFGLTGNAYFHLVFAKRLQHILFGKTLVKILAKILQQ